MYKAKKPCKFGDTDFFVDETIPDELVDKDRAKALIKYGVIEFVPVKSQDAQDSVNYDSATDGEPAADISSDDGKQAFNDADATADETKSKRPAKKGGK